MKYKDTKYKLALIILLFLSFNCHNKNKTKTDCKKQDFNFFEGIYFEKEGSFANDFNEVNLDNEIYLPGSILYFNYFFIKNKDTLKCRISNVWNEYNVIDGAKWTLIDHKDVYDDYTIAYFSLHTLEGFGTFKKEKEYNQTIMKINYYGPSNEIVKARNFYEPKFPFPMGEQTGLVENCKNVWLHPNRSTSSIFKILELSPFPFIQSPYQIGHRWSWSLRIGDMWGDIRWKKWEGTITNKYTYEITGKKNITTALGVLACFQIEGTARSRLGTTKLTSFFNQKYGFVDLHYTNIDGSEMIIKMINKP